MAASEAVNELLFGESEEIFEGISKCATSSYRDGDTRKEHNLKDCKKNSELAANEFVHSLNMLKSLIQKQNEVLTHYFDHLNLAAAEIFLNTLKECRGMLFFTGVGKSGFIAQKIAATLMSTGTRAAFLAPVDALHGDVGMVQGEDVVLILSKSGETDELLHLLPTLRNKGAKLCAITSNLKSRLAIASDIAIELPCLAELCPFDLAPTMSTAIQLLFGDLIAMALMKEKEISLSDFSKNHPAGSIGRRATLRVRDLMVASPKIPICRPHDALKEVLVDFTSKRCGCLVIVDPAQTLLGIFTDGDLRRALQSKGGRVLEEKLEGLMTSKPRFIQADSLAIDALRLMESDQKNPIMVLPVLEASGKVSGLIKMHDIVQAGL